MLKRLAKLSELYKGATYTNELLDPGPAKIILDAFDNIINKEYEALEQAAFDISSALGQGGMEVEAPLQWEMRDNEGGLKFQIGYPRDPVILVVKNASLGVAWRKFGDKYKVKARLIDPRTGKRLMLSDIEASSPKAIPRRR